ELVALYPLDQIIIERRAFAGFAERAIAGETPSAASNLRNFICAQVAPLMAIELAARGERDMVDIHVETHADSVGRDQEVYFPALSEPHLRVAGARTERAHPHGSTAAMPA